MKRNRFVIVSICLMLLLSGCARSDKPEKVSSNQEVQPIQIGLSWDTFVLERWQRDRDVFTSTATEMGAEINIQNANGDIEKQISQIEYLMEKQVDVIVVVAVESDSEGLQKAVNKAQKAGIKIVAYDRLIKNANVDLYISFDNEKVGELMAQYALDDLASDGKIAAILGAPKDNNVSQVETGLLRVLEENDQHLVYKNYVPEWKAEYGYEYTEDCLNQLEEIDVLICGNDTLASEAYRALAERKLVNKVKLIGQDADISACQRIVEDQQYMTVYKDLQTLAKQAAQYSVALAKDKAINTQNTIFDGLYEVPAYCLEPVAVTKDNLEEEIIDSQFHFRDQVYLHSLIL